MSAKREKLACASMSHLQSFKNLKMESGEDDGDGNEICGHITTDSHLYKNATIRCKITKMPLLGLKCWLIHLDDVQMTCK